MSVKKNKSGWLVTVTVDEIRKKCKDRKDDQGKFLLASVEGFAPSFQVTCKKSVLEGKTDEELMKPEKPEPLNGKEIKASE